MRGVLKTLLLLLLAGSAAGLNPAATAGQIVSTPRNVRAVMQARGFYLAPAADAPAAFSAGGVDLAPAQSFEIIRPRGERVRIGRLYTSCTCVQLETAARDYGEGERAIFTLHNVIATPPQGHTYAIYVQITSPIRTTLRYDTFMQSSQFVQQALPEPVESAGTVGQAGQVVATTPEGIEIIDLTGTMDTEAETAEDPAPAGTAAEAAGAAVGSAAGTAVETAKEVYDAAKEKAGSAAAAVGAAAANAAATTKSRFGAAVEAGRAGLRAAREAYTESREGLSEDIQSALDSELEVEEEAEATAGAVAAEANKAAGAVAAEAGKAANAAGAVR